MKKWKIIKKISIAVLILFMLILFFDLIRCIGISNLIPIDAPVEPYKWTNQFREDLKVFTIIWRIPLIINTFFLVLACVKTKGK